MADPTGQWKTLQIERGITVQIFLLDTNTVATQQGFTPKIIISVSPLDIPNNQARVAARQPIFTAAVAALAGNTIAQVVTASNKQTGTLWRAWQSANHTPNSGTADDLVLIGWT